VLRVPRTRVGQPKRNKGTLSGFTPRGYHYTMRPPCALTIAALACAVLAFSCVRVGLSTAPRDAGTDTGNAETDAGDPQTDAGGG
jgi:hypothetical protein